MPIQAVHQFPQGFLWGCATAAHQVEGQNVNDWWRWEQTPGHIFQNQKVGRACEWWSGRYAEDFDRAVEMHNNAQRISVEWSRIEPEPGRWDEYALERYRDMLKAMIERGMTPLVTLHHFTNPLWIADHNGWLWDETPVFFERFARKVTAALGDLCSFWCTINEPAVYATGGFSLGIWPPGERNGGALSQVMLNMVRGHALAYHAIKTIQPKAQVGFSVHYIGLKPSPPAVVNWLATDILDLYVNRAFVLALLDGYARVPLGKKVFIPGLKGAFDWVGLQYYQQFRVSTNFLSPGSFFINQVKPHDMPVGPGTWGGIYPEAIFDIVKTLSTLSKKPIYITESGVPDSNDNLRPDYLVRTIRSLWKATNFNFPVKGFFFWSLLDNFEWADGYDPRFNFGLYKTNFETQERTPRPSARLYGEICGANGISSETVERYSPELVPRLFPGQPGLAEVKLKAK